MSGGGVDGVVVVVVVVVGVTVVVVVGVVMPLVKVDALLPLAMVGGGGDLRDLPPASLASYFARNSAFSSTAVNTRELPELEAGGTGVGLGPVLALGLRPGEELPFVLGDNGGCEATLLARSGG